MIRGIPEDILIYLKENKNVGRTGLAKKFSISETRARRYVDKYHNYMEFVEDNIDIKNKLLSKLKSCGKISKIEIIRDFNIDEFILIKAIDDITKETGLPVYADDIFVQLNPSLHKKFDQQYYPELNKTKLKIGIVSDTHFCSKYQQLSVLNKAYEHFDKKNVDLVVHAGDLSDGSPNMHRGIVHEQFLHTFQEHLLYIEKQYPRSDKFKTFIRKGNHDDSWLKNSSGDIVEMFSRSRDDIVYVPQDAPYINLKSGILLEMFHPSGGMPYAKSYRGQKIYESQVSKYLGEYYSNRILKLPHILIIGHLHSFNYHISGYTHVFLVPSMQSTTPYLMSKSLNSTVGYMILDINISDDGNITKITPHVYDMGAYVRKNDY